MAQWTLISNYKDPYKFCFYLVAAMAPWFCLHLPFCGPEFESQAHHLRFFQFVLLKLYQENNENKQKEAGIGPFKKVLFLLPCNTCDISSFATQISKQMVVGGATRLSVSIAVKDINDVWKFRELKWGVIQRGKIFSSFGLST